MKNSKKKRSERLVAFILTFVMMFGMFVVVCQAENELRPMTVEEFSARPVEEDLADLVNDYETYPDMPYDASLYWYDDIPANLRFVRIYEYGFNEKDFTNYGLFIYVYDEDGAIVPSLKNDLSAEGHMIVDMARPYLLYAQFDCVDISEDGRFLKFRLSQLQCDSIFKETVDPYNDRDFHYNRTYIFNTPLDFFWCHAYTFYSDVNFKGSYTFSGFQDGFSESLIPYPFALQKDKEKEIIFLDAYSTYWRTISAAGDNNLRQQINSIYFIVPDIVDDYAYLEYMRMKYEEYVTKPLLIYQILGNDEFGGYLDDNRENLLKSDFKPAFDIVSDEYILRGGGGDGTGFEEATYELTYNVKTNWLTKSDMVINSLSWWFGVENIEDPVSRESLKKYVDLPNAKGLYYDNFPIETKLDKYIYKDDFEIVGKLEGYGYSDFMTKVQDYGLGETLLRDWGWFGKGWDETSISQIKPIIEFSDDTFLNSYGVRMSDEELANSLMVAVEDIDHIRELYKQAQSENGHLVLVRFDVSDYKCWDVDIRPITDFWGNGELKGHTTDKARIDIQSYYKGIEILEMGLMNEAQELTVVEVDMVPIDLIGDGNTPAKPTVDKPMPDYLALISLALGVVGILVVTAFVAKYGSEFFGWVFKKRRKKE